MLNTSRGLILASLLSVAGIGCQNSLYKENQDLRLQNQELQTRLDESSRQPVVAATPAPQPAPAIPASAIQTKPEPAPVFTDPAPAPAPAPIAPAPAPKPDFGTLEVTHDAVAGTTTVNLPSDVFFSPGQAILQENAKKSLAKVAAILKKDYAGKPITIQGYTDSDPIHKSHWKSNEELSEKRADAVRDYLVSKGVATSRITTEGLGPKNPKSATDKSKNRRVELVVATGK